MIKILSIYSTYMNKTPNSVIYEQPPEKDNVGLELRANIGRLQLLQLRLIGGFAAQGLNQY